MTRTPIAGGRAEVTIKDIAAYLGVSHATVSRALNDHAATSEGTKTRVRQAAEQLGYIRNTAAGSLSGSRSRLVGFIVPDVQSDFYSSVAKVLSIACSQAGFQLVLAVSEDDPERELQHVLSLREARAAGLIVTPTAGLLAKTADLLGPMPAVQLIRSNPLLDKRWVGIDDRIGVNAATRYLLDLGHERIGFIGGYEALTTGSERRGGYADALKSAGAEYDDTIVLLGPPRASFGLEAALALTAMDPPITGLVVGSSQLTIGALGALQQRRLNIPRDLSVVGYSDPDWFRLWGPGLSTMDLSVEDIAAAAAQMLFRAMEAGGDAPGAGRGGLAFQPALVERGSAATRTRP